MENDIQPLSTTPVMQEIPPEPLPPMPPLPPPTTAQRLAPFLVAVICMMVMIGSFLFAYTVSSPKNELVISDQPYAPRLRIKKVTLVRGGFVVIRTAQRALQLVARTDYLPVDTYLDIPADTGLPEMVKPQTGDTVFAQLYKDTDGDFQFSWKDTPAKNFLGRPVSVAFKLHGEINQ